MRMGMAVVLALALPGAVAEPVRAQGQPSAAAVAAATVFVDTLTPPAASKAALEQQLAGVRQGSLIRAQLGNNPRFAEKAAKNEPDFVAALARMGAQQAGALAPIYTEMQGAVRSANIQAYATNFTIAELNSATAFYRSPLGAKLLTTQPRIAALVNQQVQQQFAPRLLAAQQALAPKLDAELKTIFPPLPAAK
jgi:hypothetical protein